LNFASPYKATSIIEFWTRWHISLSQFLRNYLYIPLGGNRRGTVRRYANLMITMLLGGLWHGAAWTFVIWGGLHGTLIAANHLLRLHYKPSPTPTAAIVWTKRIAVFLAVTVAWVFFRADSLGSAINMLAGLSGAGGIGQVAPLSLVYLAACLFIAWILPNTNQIFERSMPTLPPNPDAGRPAPRMLLWAPNLAWAVAAGGALAGCALAMNQASPFLYFRF
jgi:D-alanyl-lipoteichoic acid acyltransferase DltB (MBOAT superfamily)